MMQNRSLLPGADEGFRTVVPEADESVHAYVHRLARAYGLPSVKPVLAKISQGGPRPFTAVCAPRLAELGGVSVGLVARLAGFDADYMAGVSVWTFGRERTSHFPGVNCRHLPICTECLRTRTYVPAFVHLSAMSACPVHGCRLVRVCPNCKAPLRTDRPQLNRCGCRFSLDDIARESASQDEQVFASAVYSRITGTASVASMLQSSSGRFNLAALELDDLVYLHWALGHVLPKPRACALGTRRRLHPSESTDATRACVAVLRSPGEVVPLVRAWLRLFADRTHAEGALPFGLFRSILKRMMRMRGIPMISRLIAEELETLPGRRRYQPSVGPRPSPQLMLFEETL